MAFPKNLMNLSYKLHYFLSKIALLLFSFTVALSPLYSESEETEEIDIEIQNYLNKIKEYDSDEKKLKELLEEREKNQNQKFIQISEEDLFNKILEFNNINTKKYIVKPKDTLFSIAKEFKMSLSQIYYLNPELKNKNLTVGMELNVLDVPSDKNNDSEWRIEKKEIFEDQSYIVQKGDTLNSIAKKYKLSVQELMKLNNFKKNTILKPKMKILISRYKIIKEYKVRNYFLKPVDGNITSTFGYRKNPFINSFSHFHKGIDIAADLGAPILAAREGLVIYSGRMIGFGNCIFIRHEDGYITVYGHNKINLVKVGDIVQKGQKIGEVGRTGYATGPHLHFEIRKMNVPLNPLIALQWQERLEISIKRVALK